LRAQSDSTLATRRDGRALAQQLVGWFDHTQAAARELYVKAVIASLSSVSRTTKAQLLRGRSTCLVMAPDVTRIARKMIGGPACVGFTGASQSEQNPHVSGRLML